MCKIVRNDYNGDYLELSDGTEVHFVHEQNCCECVYADLSALEDTGFENDNITIKNLDIKLVKGYGLRLNGYGIPCYNSQNGWYSSDIEIQVIKRIYVDVHRDLGIWEEC